MILDGINVTLLYHNRSLFRRGSRKFNSIIVLLSLMGERYYIGVNTRCTIRSSNHSLRVLLETLRVLSILITLAFTTWYARLSASIRGTRTLSG
jgi:hypothetical protein